MSPFHVEQSLVLAHKRLELIVNDFESITHNVVLLLQSSERSKD